MSLSLRLPATSANLGPGFDTLALALDLYLEIEAVAAPAFSIRATGRSPEICSALEGNLLLDTYRDVWRRSAGGEPQPLALELRNEIPLGMGCGSSAASRLAAVALASHFASLGWDERRMLDEAAALERHPDNAAACCLGGFVAAGFGDANDAGPRRVEAAHFAPPAAWRALLVLPAEALPTPVSRSVLPAEYRREAVVANLQHVALLVAAFARGDGTLLRAGTRDQVHQPYRAQVCPLLEQLLPLAGVGGILSVTLSGAGSAVLLLLREESAAAGARFEVLARTEGGRGAAVSFLLCGLPSQPALLR